VTGTVLLGIRHHGPGSARSVERALAAYRPGIVLIEGPPEADRLVALAGSPEMRPPVALLAYPVDKDTVASSRAAFWPFAEFSPEWRALRWAVAASVPVRFFDLPAAHRFAPDVVVDSSDDHSDPVRADPLAALAAAAGYDDPERWWEDVVEHRMEVHPGEDPLAAALEPFLAIGEAMAEVRAHTAAPPAAEAADEARREAYMRGVLRAARKQHDRVAVVCGAWHVPALTDPLPTATSDTKLLRGLRKVKVAATWVPWTHGRLASWQGYGAGVSSPGWYHHLFTAPDRVVQRWLVAVAGVLREEGQPISSAHVIEAVRLAEALATLRGRPLAGLAEVTEATHAVLCDGDDLRLQLVNRRLVVGERLGEVPADTPAVPLARDVAAAQRRLRLPPSALQRDVDLDLRREIDLGRSRLLHRLRLLGIEWALPAPQRSGKGTFWESWRLEWRPEFAVDLVSASGYGTTLVDAAGAYAAEAAGRAARLAEVTALVERCLLADLPAALAAVLRALDERIALDHDVAHLMAALPALARALRYGDVRGTDTAALATVADGLVLRICVGLPPALAALDDAAAAEMRGHVDAVQAAVAMLDREAAARHQPAARPGAGGVPSGGDGVVSAGGVVADGGEAPGGDGVAPGGDEVSDAGAASGRGAATRDREPGSGAGSGSATGRWLDTLERVAGRDDLHGLIAGRLNRLLLDAGRLDADEARRRLGLTLTVGTPPARGAAWIEGFLAGGGLLLVHDHRLLALVDGWLAGIPADTFVEVLPLLRRTFGEFSQPERRAIGERARRLGDDTAAPEPTQVLDRDRVAPVLPTLALLLGRNDLPTLEEVVR
jgi:hypothetical protein